MTTFIFNKIYNLMGRERIDAASSNDYWRLTR